MIIDKKPVESYINIIFLGCSIQDSSPYPVVQAPSDLRVAAASRLSGLDGCHVSFVALTRALSTQQISEAEMVN